jgi:YbgC/YbaW family acyl-CoA thioester hydrolase
MEKILKSRHLIRFQDCDPFNHLNNARYLDYFINAREDQVYEQYGLSVFENAKTTGKSWMVASNQIIYLKPANLMEKVTIESRLIQYSNKTLLVEMKMWDKTETELKAVLWIKFIHVDIRTNSVATHADDHMKLFESVVVPIQMISFEERCGVIQQEIKLAKA